MTAVRPRCAACGARCAVCGVRYAVCGVRCAVCGVRCAMCGVRCAVCGVRRMLPRCNIRLVLIAYIYLLFLGVITEKQEFFLNRADN